MTTTTTEYYCSTATAAAASCSDRSRYGFSRPLQEVLPPAAAAAFMACNWTTSLLQPGAGSSTDNNTSIPSCDKDDDADIPRTSRPSTNKSCLMFQQSQLDQELHNFRVDHQQSTGTSLSPSPPSPSSSSSSCQQQAPDQARAQIFFRAQQQAPDQARDQIFFQAQQQARDEIFFRPQQQAPGQARDEIFVRAQQQQQQLMAKSSKSYCSSCSWIHPLILLLVFLAPSDVSVKPVAAAHGINNNNDSSISNPASSSRWWYSDQQSTMTTVTHLRFLAEEEKISSSVASTFNVVAVEQALQAAAFQAIAQLQSIPEYVPHNVTVPGNLSGLATAQAVRLVRHSVKFRGVSLNEFQVPNGTQIISAHVKRMIVVYQNFGSLSSTLFQLPTTTTTTTTAGAPAAAGASPASSPLVFLTPVLSLAFYDASNLSSTNPRQYSVVAGRNNITVTFASTSARILAGSSPLCFTFSTSTGNATSNGSLPTTGASGASGPPFVCSLRSLVGAVALVGQAASLAPASAPAPSPISGGASSSSGHSSNTWKIVLGSVLGGVGALALLALLGLLAFRYRERRRLDAMHRNSERGETLQQSPIGQSRAPVAGSTRTRPTLEKLE